MIAYHGEHVWPDERGGVPTLESIGIGLARIPRFAGQTREWYPVLAHTYVVMNLVPAHARLHALLHDAPEAVVADVPTTWKTQAAKDLEEVLLGRLYASIGALEPGDDGLAGGVLEEVRAADLVALNAEAHVLGHGDPTWFVDRFGAPNMHAMNLTRRFLAGCRSWPFTAPKRGDAYARIVRSELEALRLRAAA